MSYTAHPPPPMPNDDAPPPAPPPTTLWLDDTVEHEMTVWALDHLAACHGASVPAEVTRTAVAHAHRAADNQHAEPWCTRLRTAATAVGLRLSAVNEPLDQALSLLTPGANLILRAHGGGAARLVALCQRSGHKVRVVSSVASDQDGWMTMNELTALLGIKDASEAVTVVFGELAAPLDALRVPEEAKRTSPASPWARLRALIRTERNDLWVVVVYAIGVGLISLAAPVAVQSLVNTVAFGSLIQPLLVLSLVLMACLIAAAILRILQFYVVEIIQRRLFVRVAADLAFRLPRVRIDAFEGKYGPALVNRFFDVLTLQKSTSSLLLDGLALLLQAGTGMLLLAFYHPVLLAFDVLLIGALSFIVFVLGRSGTPTAIKESKAKYEVAAWLQELARTPATFRAAGGAKFAIRKADSLAKDYLQARTKHFGVLLRQMSGMLMTQVLASTVLLGLGGWLVMQRQLTLGQLVAAELVVTSVVAGFGKLARTFGDFYKMMAGLDKLGSLIDLPLEREQGEMLPAKQQSAALSLRNVTYVYPGGHKSLVGLNLDVAPGERLALVGSSGGGKGTLLEVAFGMRTPTSGAVLLDDIDLRDLRLESLRHDVLMLNGVEIIDGTIVENLRLGRIEVTPDEVRDALRTVNLLDDVLNLPEGLNTHLVPSGAPLSSGQARRLVLARALVVKPRLLLVRETLDTIASHSRTKIIEAILGPKAPWTVLLVSHDPQVIAACSRAVDLGALGQPPNPSPAVPLGGAR
ncbi:MAG: ATP-binding cassette domain-containing protein [Deltaproteobacteria bacterium]|nr:ATP-binding cassette domain-containing protein [Deltaproteobacteria bacterium]